MTEQWQLSTQHSPVSRSFLAVKCIAVTLNVSPWQRMLVRHIAFKSGSNERGVLQLRFHSPEV
jgi:hypothetical protein